VVTASYGVLADYLLADWVAWLGLYHAAFCFIFSSSDVFIGLSLLGRVAGCTMLLLLNETETLSRQGGARPHRAKEPNRILNTSRSQIWGKGAGWSSNGSQRRWRSAVARGGGGAIATPDSGLASAAAP
jgi:hypothetical protein